MKKLLAFLPFYLAGCSSVPEQDIFSDISTDKTKCALIQPRIERNNIAYKKLLGIKEGNSVSVNQSVTVVNAQNRLYFPQHNADEGLGGAVGSLFSGIKAKSLASENDRLILLYERNCK